MLMLTLEYGMASDEWQIRQLAFRYAQAADRADGPAMRALFAADGRIEGHGYLFTSAAQIERIPSILREAYLRTYHAVHNHRIDLQGDAAEGEVYGVAHHITETSDGGYQDLSMTMRYEDSYRRINHVWKFACRTLHIDWTQTQPIDRDSLVLRPPA
jgi:hypothetical protein